MTQFPDLFASLAAPFEAHEVRSRSQAGRQVHYITARTAMNRLDSILGPENWWDEYVPGENSVLCRLTVRLPDGSTLTKADAGGYAGMQDQGDDDKSGFSDAFKRAAVKFGVGRYLYRDGVPSYQRTEDSGKRTEDSGKRTEDSGKRTEDSGKRTEDSGLRTQGEMRGVSPAPVESAAPRIESAVPSPQSSTLSPQSSTLSPQSFEKAPRSGRAMFAWTKDQEQKHEVGLLKYLNSWAKLQEFPGRMVDWDAEQVNQAYAEALRKLQSISVGQAEVYEEALAN